MPTTTDRSNISIRAVEAFIATVEEGSVSAAAKRLGNSVSAISLQLANLEAVLGARLLVRSSRQFALTPAGEAFHPRALRILDEMTAARAAVTGAGASARMLIKMAIIEDFDRFVLPVWLPEIRKLFPAIRCNIRSGPSHENHVALGSRTVDMIVAVESIDTADWVEQHSILRDPYILVTSSQLSSRLSIDGLMKAPFVRYSRDLLMGRQIEAQLRRSRFAPQWEHEFSSNQAVFSMVEAVGGWTITTAAAFASTASTNEYSDHQGLVASRVPIPAFSRTISLFSRKDALGNMPARFSDVLRGAIQTELIDPLQKAFPFIAEDSGLQTLLS